MAQPGESRPRVILAKPGLDGHDRGVKVVGMALRDAGAEVVYLGLQQTPKQIVAAAVAEDVDIIRLSVLSGVREMGVRDVFPVGTSIEDLVSRIFDIASED